MKRPTTPPRSFRPGRNIAWLTRRRDALLKRLRATGPFINGSVVLIARTCGNSDHCHCRRGPKHVSTYLTFAVAGKTQTIYVPVDLETDVRRWSAQYRDIKDLIREIGNVQREIIRKHVEERRRRP